MIPPNKDSRQFPAFEVKVGYTTLPNRNPPFNSTVDLDITLNDVVSDKEYRTVDEFSVHISSVEDIIAENYALFFNK